jgi:hypothetical protein
MAISIENDNYVIVYTLERIIAYVWKFQPIFVGECVWSLAFIIRLKSVSIQYINKLQSGLATTNISDQEQVAEREEPAAVELN